MFQKLRESRAMQQAKQMFQSRFGRQDSTLEYEPPSLDWSDHEKRFATELLPDPSGADKTFAFLEQVFHLLVDYVQKQNDRSTKVLDFHYPHQLLEIMNHCLYIHEQPCDLEQILSDCKETLKYCVRTGHPHFLNQLSSGLDIIGLAGEWLIATVNTNMFTYEAAPVFILMELTLLDRMRKLVGWANGDGIFSPGGAISNLYGVLVARHHACPAIKENGMSGMTQMVMFTSEQSHFSIRRAAALLGIGTDNVVAIGCDERGKMVVPKLEEEICLAKRNGKLPFFVNATCGSTVLGAFDPIKEIADVCERHNLWLHVDGAWGASTLLSGKHRHLLDNIQRVNSITWNPHKMLGVPLQCSAFLVNDKEVLQSCNGMHANYLFQKDKHYDINYDTGDKSIQCGRHNDIFKFWLMWRAKGDKGFENHINRIFELAGYLRKLIRKKEGFDLVLEQGESTNVCFWYIPKSLREMSVGLERNKQLNTVAPRIKARMMKKGSLMVGYQPMGNLPNFFRVVISSAAATTEDLDFLVEEMDRLGSDLQPV